MLWCALQWQELRDKYFVHWRNLLFRTISFTASIIPRAISFTLWEEFFLWNKSPDKIMRERTAKYDRRGRVGCLTGIRVALHLSTRSFLFGGVHISCPPLGLWFTSCPNHLEMIFSTWPSYAVSYASFSNLWWGKAEPSELCLSPGIQIAWPTEELLTSFRTPGKSIPRLGNQRGDFPSIIKMP